MTARLSPLAFKGGSISQRLQLLRATEASGHRAYYFLDVPPLKRAQLEHTLARAESLDLSQFGEVVACGWGEDVPQDVVARMQAEYGWAA